MEVPSDVDAEPVEKAQSQRNQSAQRVVRIGDLLIKEGFLKEEQLQKGLSIQREEASLSQYPLGHILIEMGALSSSDLKDLLNHPDLKRSIGSLAVEKGWVSTDQLEDCLRKKLPDQLLGEVFVNEGLLNKDQMEELIQEQLQAPRLGELAVQRRMINEETLERAIKIQRSPRMIGEILCDSGMVNPLDLHYVLSKYKKQIDLAQVLLSLKYIEEKHLNEALSEQKDGSESLGDFLLRKRLITEQQLQEAVSRLSNMPYRSLEGFGYSNEAKKTLTSIISQRYAEKNLILPISLVDNRLTLGLLRADELHAVRELKELYKNFSIFCVLITAEKFNELFEVLYSSRLAALGERTEPGGIEATESEDVNFMQITLDESLDDSEQEGPAYDAQDLETEEVVNFIIKYGISNGASDIHLEQDRSGAKLRYRIDGAITDVGIEWLKKKIHKKYSNIISRIKIMSSLDIAEKRLPHDGVFRISCYDKVKGTKKDIDFRVATCPSILGENVTIRILDPKKEQLLLQDLNHSPHVLEPLKVLVKRSSGLILVTGPTGCGKSSTLYAVLKYIYNPTIKIITAEDPIEYSFPGIMQTQVHTKINLTFARLLRSILRLDPDVILVGEIRDDETAKIALDASQTGHLVLSTLHTNDSISAIPRLHELGLERSQISSCLMCVLAQRLVKSNCLVCIEEYTPSEDEWIPLFEEYPSHLRFYKGKGCENCGYTGSKGRTLLSEMFFLDEDISRAIGIGEDLSEVKALAMEKGMKTMLDDGLMKLRHTTLSEIIRVVPQNMIDSFRKRSHGGAIRGESSLQRVGGKRFSLSNPEEEQDIIDQMHAEYKRLTSRTNQPETRVARSVFGEFIRDSFHDIRKRYNCRSVGFNIEHKGSEIEISAIPNG